ncbi:MAG TPA: hypothetical protein VLI67_06390 [Vicinamibacteria bacterium]|nr:hypothetical protein [Vicinamibacteria bacterium]
MMTAVADPEAAYYQSIEEFFVSRRGDPLFLSNADWHLVRKWRQAGIPLRVVLRGIRDALESHALGWSRDRKVGSLAYCAREVDEARERWERSLGLGGEPGLDAATALLGFAAELERARGLGPRGRAEAGTIARELRERAGEGTLAEVEPWLAAREARLVEAIREDAGAAFPAALEAQVDDALAPYRERMPSRVLEQIRHDSIVRRLLEAEGLPRLSLFHLATGAGGAAGVGGR